MIRTFSKKLLPPYSGQVQIAETDEYRALTVDAQVWEIQYVNRTHVRVATLSVKEIKTYAEHPEQMQQEVRDERIIELLRFLASVALPFTPADSFEYWLLENNNPLALIFSCTDASQIEKFPDRPEWTALPAAVMPVEKTTEETAKQSPPVNYTLELLVAERAGNRPQAQWFDRREASEIEFPPLLINESWNDPTAQLLCQRYLQRQAPRLLMLHKLNTDDRGRLERYCKPQAMEVARFCGLYPHIENDALIQALRVEAQLRSATEGQPAINQRRDGILYI